MSDEAGPAGEQTTVRATPEHVPPGSEFDPPVVEKLISENP